jgi:hypothetical protein
MRDHGFSSKEKKSVVSVGHHRSHIFLGRSGDPYMQTTNIPFAINIARVVLSGIILFEKLISA